MQQKIPLYLALVALLVAIAAVFLPVAPPAYNPPISAKGTTNFSDVAADTGTITSLTATSFTLGGVAVSGGFKYGVATGVVSGTTIAHGVGSLPSMISLTPYTTSNDFNSRVYVLARDATNITVGITPTTNINVYWIAGK
jgi:hypothetical protein